MAVVSRKRVGKSLKKRGFVRIRDIPARGLGRNWDEGASGERREGRWSCGGDGSRYISTAMRYGFS